MNNETTPGIWQLSAGGRYAVMAVFGIVISVGVVGNLLVFSLIVAVKKMQTAVNLCLASLAVADLLVLGFLPIFPILQLYKQDDSILGKSFCYFLSGIDRGSMVCTCFTFLFVSVERYIALCHPLKAMAQSQGRKVTAAITTIWLLTIGLCAPYSVATKYESVDFGNVTSTLCYQPEDTLWLQVYDMVILCFVYFLPVPILTFLYGRMIFRLKTDGPKTEVRDSGTKNAQKSRSQVVVMLLSVVIIFVVCHLPVRVYSLMYFYAKEQVMSLDAKSNFSFLWFARILLYVNNSSNPVVYFAVSSNFRNAFHTVFCQRCTSQPGVSTTPQNRIRTVSKTPQA